MLDFIAIDFETANYNQAPCSLGLTFVENNQVKENKCFLINPKESFNSDCIKIHGIKPADVAESPEFPILWNDIEPLLTSYPVLAHNMSFDYSVLEKALRKYQLPIPNLDLYCSMLLAKHNFPQFKSFSLVSLCESFHIPLKNHHACDEDSLACALLTIEMMKSPKFQLLSYHPKATTKMSYDPKIGIADFEEAKMEYDNISYMAFENKIFVFTGDIEGYERSDVENLVAERGGIIKNSVVSKTDYLIVGLQNLNVVKDKTNIKSTKIIKAEKLQESGSDIKIVSDVDFLKFLNGTTDESNWDGWNRFPDDESKLEQLKILGLTPKTASEPKQLYYQGIYSKNKLIPIEILGVLNDYVVVIKISDGPHKIHLDYLKEMQPTKKEAEQLSV